MLTTTAPRPYLVPKKYVWKAEDQTVTPGIGLMHRGLIRAHLTLAEAYELADHFGGPRRPTRRARRGRTHPQPAIQRRQQQGDQLMAQQKHDKGVQKRRARELAKNPNKEKD
jgi:hypothetical protein